MCLGRWTGPLYQGLLKGPLRLGLPGGVLGIKDLT